MTDKGKKR